MKLPIKSARLGLVHSNQVYKSEPSHSLNLYRSNDRLNLQATPELQMAAASRSIEFILPQANEIELIREIQGMTWLESFASEILTLKSDIKEKVDALPIARFNNYSGLRQSGYLGKFFYIARYVDEIEKDEYMERYIDNDSPMYTINTVNEQREDRGETKIEFDRKPWTVGWSEIPQYTKDYVFKHRIEIGRGLSVNLNRPQDFGLESPQEYKTEILNLIGDVYDDFKDIYQRWHAEDYRRVVEKVTESLKEKLRRDPNDEELEQKVEESIKRIFLGTAAAVGTSSSIVQYQDNGKIYIQGYLMNILDLNSPHEVVKRYYQTAVDEKDMGLLSGPSGTSHRIVNLVRELEEIFRGYPNLNLLRLKTTALCLAALGVPYNCHSFYEIVTVTFPDIPELHDIETFKSDLLQEGLL